ncbi:MAG TPA: YlxM family DNA-binding protein [Clostridiales bacterium]|nr:YlxM family DNA-binding protein [Clostridiales bacterium]
MEKIYEIGLLLDYYGQLLTKRQYEILDLYYNNDYSLGEISEELGISRQGVYDNLRRGMALLNKYESSLGLLERRFKQKDKVKFLLELVEEIDATVMNNNDKEILTKIRETVKSLFDDI